MAVDDHGLSKLAKFVNEMDVDSEAAKPDSRMNDMQQHKPNDFGLLPSRKLTVGDLAATISDSHMKNSLKHLDSEPSATKKAGIPGKLAVPLAKRQQDRIDRAAALEKSKETLNRWIDTVKHNRRSEHLSFPLPEPNAVQKTKAKDAKPVTDLEKTIQNIMVESGLTDDNNNKKRKTEDYDSDFSEPEDQIEGLEAKKISQQEQQARRDELRKARNMMFEEERKAKRIKNIKSKSYRRVHRKEREKNADKEKQALAAAGVEPDDEEVENAERQRALTRMGAKHRESKFAKGLKQSGRAAWDEDARASILGTAQRKAELQRRIEGHRIHGVDADEEYLSSSSEDNDEEDGIDPFAPDAEEKRLKKKVDRLAEKSQEAPVTDGPYSNLMSMKFMQNAEATRKAANDEAIKQLRHDLREHSDNEEGSSASSDEEVEVAGRQKYGKGTESSRPSASRKPQSKPSKDSHDDDTSDDEAPLKIFDTAPTKQTTKPSQPLNPFKSTRNQATVAGSAKPGPSTTKDEESDDEDAVINFDAPEAAPKPAQKKQDKKSVSWQSRTEASTDGSGSGSESESEGVSETEKQNKNENHRQQATGSAPVKVHLSEDEDDRNENENQVPILSNEDLVKRAFAGDEVYQDFKKEKEEIVQEEDDKVVDTTLPGWGSWVGDGLSKRDKKTVKRSTETIEGLKPQQRKDAKLDRVILNQKKVKKNDKYLATQLPHPFESRQQYERSLRLPIGPEWTTKQSFQKATKPRILLKQGVIKPPRKPLI